MAVEFKGPNPKFTDFTKSGAGKVGKLGVKKTDFESVNHQDFSGKNRLADTNPGSDRVNAPQYGKNPAEKEMRDGKQIPQIGGKREIGSETKVNEPPRAFVYSREGHAVDNGGASEGQS